jgi:hypothetical protein
MAVINLGDKDGMGSSFTGTYSASDINNAINAAGIPSNCKVTSLTVEFRGAKSTSTQGSGSITLTLGSYSATYSGVIANNGFDNSFSDSDKICYDSKIINYVNSKGRFNNNLVFALSKGSSLTGWRVNAKLHIEYTIPYTISVSAGAGGSVTNTGGTYNAGTTFSVQANPSIGYKFKGWANSSGVIATTANPYSFTVSGSAEFSAVFEPILYYVTYNANGGSGAMDGASVYFGNNYTLSNNGFTAPEVTVTFDFDDGVSANKVEKKSKTFRGWEDWGDITANTGRVLTANEFDAPYYVRHPNHPDLLQILGHNKFSLANHYVNDGEREGRPCISTDGTRGYYDAGTVVNSLCTTQSAVCRLYAQWNGCTFNFPSVPERDGYEFLYWKWVGTNNTYSVTQLKINEDATFKAVWKQTKKFGAYAGDKQATVYVGDKPVKEIYVGSTKVYG